MGATTGIVKLGDYTTPPTVGGKVDVLLALIANPDTTSSTGAIAGGGLLDEMSPPAVAQLRVELAALRLALNGGSAYDGIAYGKYTVTAADATANQADVVTGLADTALTELTVKVIRAGSNVTADAVVSEPAAGTIRVADGSTYNTTAGDVIIWIAFDPAA